MQKFVPILRVGRYKDSSGKNVDITPQVLKEIQESYQSKSAPLVKGHPSADAPSLGWIDKLKIQGQELLASFSDVTEEFKQEVEQRSFKNISASYFMPLSESNPSKGKHCLRHVGALGASRPAIPNLGTLQEALAFSESEEDITCYVEFAEQEESFGFFEKLIKGAMEKALKKQREEIMADVKKIVGNVNFNEGHSSSQTEQQNIEGENFMSDKKTAREIELEEKLKKAEDERDRLKSEQDKGERSKGIADAVAKVKDEKNLDDATAQKLQEKAEASSEVDPQKAVASFAEFIPEQKKTTTHRFGDKTPEQGKGVASFAEGDDDIVNSAEYADEVDKHMKDGVTRQEAHTKAVNALKK